MSAVSINHHGTMLRIAHPLSFVWIPYCALCYAKNEGSFIRIEVWRGCSDTSCTLSVTLLTDGKQTDFSRNIHVPPFSVRLKNVSLYWQILFLITTSVTAMDEFLSQHRSRVIFLAKQTCEYCTGVEWTLDRKDWCTLALWHEILSFQFQKKKEFADQWTSSITVYHNEPVRIFLPCWTRWWMMMVFPSSTLIDVIIQSNFLFSSILRRKQRSSHERLSGCTTISEKKRLFVVSKRSKVTEQQTDWRVWQFLLLYWGNCICKVPELAVGLMPRPKL